MTGAGFDRTNRFAPQSDTGWHAGHARRKNMREIEIPLGIPIIPIQQLTEGETIIGELKEIKALPLSDGLVLQTETGPKILPITATMRNVAWEEYIGRKLRFVVSFVQTKRGRAFKPRVFLVEENDERTEQEPEDVPF